MKKFQWPIYRRKMSSLREAAAVSMLNLFELLYQRVSFPNISKCIGETTWECILKLHKGHMRVHFIMHPPRILLFTTIRPKILNLHQYLVIEGFCSCYRLFIISSVVIIAVLLWIGAHHSTDYRQAPWYKLSERDEVIINATILSTSKNIIVVDRWPKNQTRPTSDFLTFDESKSVCEKFCRNLYFPATLEENNELRLFLDDIERSKQIHIFPWLRVKKY